jgi:hypothetical protein
MSDLNSAAAALKQSAGLPTNVNPPVAPLPAGSAPVNAQVQAAPPPPKSAEELLSLKDQAITDANERIKALEAAQEIQMSGIAKMIDAKLNPVETPKPVELPPLPENIDDLPPKEQIELIADRKASEKVQAAIIAEREALMANLGPVLMRAKQATEVTDKLAVEGRYPQFDYAKLKPEMDKLGAELPGTSVEERAALAAQRTGNEAMLLPPTQQAPMSQPAVPSMSAASGAVGAYQAQPNQNGPTQDQLWTLAAKQGMARNTVDQGATIDALLKMRGHGLPKA